MDISFNCSKCGQHILIDEVGAGIEIQCPNCQFGLIVPTPEAANPGNATQTASRAAGLGSPPVVNPAQQPAGSRKLCPKCNRSWPEDYLFCQSCGERLGMPTETDTPEPVQKRERLRLPRIGNVPRPLTEAARPVWSTPAQSASGKSESQASGKALVSVRIGEVSLGVFTLFLVLAAAAGAKRANIPKELIGLLANVVVLAVLANLVGLILGLLALLKRTENRKLALFGILLNMLIMLIFLGFHWMEKYWMGK